MVFVTMRWFVISFPSFPFSSRSVLSLAFPFPKLFRLRARKSLKILELPPEIWPTLRMDYESTSGKEEAELKMQDVQSADDVAWTRSSGVIHVHLSLH